MCSEPSNIPRDTIKQPSEIIKQPIGPQLPLTTPRLILRGFSQEDIPEEIAIASHSEFSGYLRFHPEKTPHDVTYYIEEAIKAQKPDLITGCREIFRLAIDLLEDPLHVIGCCVFHGWNKSADDIHGTPEPRFIYSLSAQEFEKRMTKQ